MEFKQLASLLVVKNPQIALRLKLMMERVGRKEIRLIQPVEKVPQCERQQPQYLLQAFQGAILIVKLLMEHVGPKQML